MSMIKVPVEVVLAGCEKVAETVQERIEAGNKTIDLIQNTDGDDALMHLIESNSDVFNLVSLLSLNIGQDKASSIRNYRFEIKGATISHAAKVKYIHDFAAYAQKYNSPFYLSREDFELLGEWL